MQIKSYYQIFKKELLFLIPFFLSTLYISLTGGSQLVISSLCLLHLNITGRLFLQIMISQQTMDIISPPPPTQTTSFADCSILTLTSSLHLTGGLAQYVGCNGPAENQREVTFIIVQTRSIVRPLKLIGSWRGKGGKLPFSGQKYEKG